MFCPVCGEKQVSVENRFCSRCGLLLTNVSAIVQSGGALPQQINSDAPSLETTRRRGVKRGAKMILTGALVVPVLAVLSGMIGFTPGLVVLAALVLFLGGFLRMIYAGVFESGNPHDATLEEEISATAKTLRAKRRKNELSSAENFAPIGQGNWRETNDLMPSVTEKTTQIFDRNPNNF